MPNPQNIDKHKFKKGQSGNPKGRPLGVRNRSTILKRWLETPVEITNPLTKKKEHATVEDQVILALINKAMKGDVGAAKEILDSMYGKATQQIQLNGEDGGPVKVELLAQLQAKDLNALLAIKRKLK